jgi:hypothetical protein
MRLRKGAGLAPANAANEARESEQLAGQLGNLATPTKSGLQGRAVRAELAGSDRCRAEGLASRGAAPVLALCRALVRAGHDPATPLEVFRGGVLALTVRTIGAGAVLTVNEDGPRFMRWRPYRSRRVSPAMRQNRQAGIILAAAADHRGD